MGINIEVTGPSVIFERWGIVVTNTVVISWFLMLALAAVCIYLTRNLKVRPETKRQLIAEKIVVFVCSFVEDIMGAKWVKFAPYIAALFSYSFFSSISSLLGLKPPTGDFTIIVGMASMTFIMVQVTNVRYKGVGGAMKRFVEPVPFILPLNIISEIASPLSMAFRHFGNITAGGIITSMLYAAMAFLSTVVLKIVPNQFIQSIPIFQVGLPAVLSIYFDLFTSFLQAYIFCMLTMVYVSTASE